MNIFSIAVRVIKVVDNIKYTDYPTQKPKIDFEVTSYLLQFRTSSYRWNKMAINADVSHMFIYNMLP